MHGASDGVDVRGGDVQGEEVKCVGREHENGGEERSNMFMDLTVRMRLFLQRHSQLESQCGVNTSVKCVRRILVRGVLFTKFSRCASKAASPTIGDVKALNKLARQLKSQPVKLQF